jgi:hypothetical protein
VHDGGGYHHHHHHHQYRNLIVNALDTELRLLRTKSLAPTVFTFGFGSAPDANMLTYALCPPLLFFTLFGFPARERLICMYVRVRVCVVCVCVVCCVCCVLCVVLCVFVCVWWHTTVRLRKWGTGCTTL